MSLQNLLTRVGADAATYTTRFLDSLRGYRVPVASWTSLRNLGLALTNTLAVAASEAGAIVKGYLDGSYLPTATGEYLTRLALSQYQLTRYPAAAAHVYLLLGAASTAPTSTAAAGALVAAPVGAATPTWTNEAAGVIVPGKYLLLPFVASTVGAAGNVVAGAALALRTARPGVSVYAAAAGLFPGADLNGGVAFATLPTWGNVVTVQWTTGVSTAASGVSDTVTIVVAPGATASDVVAAVAASASASARVAACATGTGAGAANQLFTSQILSSPVVSPGQDEETDDLLKARCVARWDSLGYGGTEAAMYFWARALPAGYSASPVSKVKVYSNRRVDGVIAGNHALVVVAGAAGALSGADLAAVAANFENPAKYPLNVVFACITTTQLVISVAGTVYYYRAQTTGDAVAAGVAAQFAAWTPTIPIGGFPGGLVRADRVKARVEAGSDAIDTVVMSAPLADVAVTWKQTVSFDLTNLVYVGV